MCSRNGRLKIAKRLTKRRASTENTAVRIRNRGEVVLLFNHGPRLASGMLK